MVTDAKLAEALQFAADIAVADHRYLPIYERLEREVMDRRSRSDTLTRALAVSKGEYRPALRHV